MTRHVFHYPLQPPLLILTVTDLFRIVRKSIRIRIKSLRFDGAHSHLRGGAGVVWVRINRIPTLLLYSALEEMEL